MFPGALLRYFFAITEHKGFFLSVLFLIKVVDTRCPCQQMANTNYSQFS